MANTNSTSAPAPADQPPSVTSLTTASFIRAGAVAAGMWAMNHGLLSSQADDAKLVNTLIALGTWSVILVQIIWKNRKQVEAWWAARNASPSTAPAKPS